ncbi:MAG: hypothetical protein RI940_436 [Bacteroidota bacterium]|jgi:hypothetical protein
MHKILIISVCIGLFACNHYEDKQSSNITWEYVAKNNQAILDHQCQPILFQYQELLKALKNRDTSYLKLVAKNAILITDSLSQLKLPIDSNAQKIWVNGVGNINAELSAMMLENELNAWDEIKMSINMCGLQVLNLLGQIGYKEHTVYIFNTNNKELEDGYYWLGLQKNSKNPYEVNKNENVSAVAILQEEIKK